VATRQQAASEVTANSAGPSSHHKDLALTVERFPNLPPAIVRAHLVDHGEDHQENNHAPLHLSKVRDPEEEEGGNSVERKNFFLSFCFFLFLFLFLFLFFFSFFSSSLSSHSTPVNGGQEYPTKHRETI